ncbi:MAG: hypothetical protein JNM25_12780 [Planctomycetes bacterium]|nr:hypothetical protein [Planctomycetota bacterium]
MMKPSRPLAMTAIVSLPPKAVRLRFTWLLPAWFAVASALGTVWPGRSNQLFCIGALAGVWVCFLADNSGDGAASLLLTLVGGVPILLLLGLLLDRLRSDLRLWSVLVLCVAAASGYVLLQEFSELDRAIDYHGSLLAFCVCALQLGSYGATIVLLAMSAGRSARG